MIYLVLVILISYSASLIAWWVKNGGKENLPLWYSSVYTERRIAFLD
jgi:hypothetical protein